MQQAGFKVFRLQLLNPRLFPRINKEEFASIRGVKSTTVHFPVKLIFGQPGLPVISALVHALPQGAAMTNVEFPGSSSGALFRYTLSVLGSRASYILLS